MVDKQHPSSGVEIIIDESQVAIAREHGAKIHRTSTPTKRSQAAYADYWVGTVEHFITNKDNYLAVFATVASAKLFIDSLGTTLRGATGVVKAAQALGDAITKKPQKEAAAREAARQARLKKAAEDRIALKLAAVKAREDTKLSIAKEREATKLAIAEKAAEAKKAEQLATAGNASTPKKIRRTTKT